MTNAIRTLLVEDSPSDAHIARELVRDIDDPQIELVHAQTLADAELQLRAAHFHAMLLDLGLGESTGIGTLHRARSFAPEIPLVVLTGLRGDELPVLAVRTSAQEYLVKDDLTPSLLRRAIVQAIGRCEREARIRKMAQDAAASEAAMRALLSDATDGLLILDPDGRVCLCNTAATALMCCVEGQMLEPFARNGDPPASQEWVSDSEQVIELHTASSHWRGRGAYLVSARDVTARKRAERNLARAQAWLRVEKDDLSRVACLDPLTECFNRRGLERLLDAELSRSDRASTRTVVMRIDCDGLRNVNERYGQEAGDAVLVEITQRLRTGLRPSDHLARVADDDFVLLVEEREPGESLRIAERLRRSVSEAPVKSGKGPIQVTISVAVGWVPSVTCTVEDLLAATMPQLTLARERGGNRVFAGPGMIPSVQRELGSAMVLEVVFQRIVRIASGATEGCELAARETRISGGTLVVDTHALEACLRVWQDHGLEGARPHFGLSAVAVMQLPEKRIELLGALGASLELGAHALQRPVLGLLERLGSLRRAGVALSVQGSQALSLETLLAAEPRWLRLGPEFHAHHGDDGEAQLRLARFVRIAEVVGADVIATGCTQPDEAERLQRLGLQLAQGEAFGGWLELVSAS